MLLYFLANLYLAEKLSIFIVLCRCFIRLAGLVSGDCEKKTFYAF